MMRAAIRHNDQKMTYIFGLEFENLRRLHQYKPIVIDLHDLGGEGDVFIFAGEDQDDLKRQLETVLEPYNNLVVHIGWLEKTGFGVGLIDGPDIETTPLIALTRMATDALKRGDALNMKLRDPDEPTHFGQFVVVAEDDLDRLKTRMEKEGYIGPRTTLRDSRSFRS